MRLFCVVSEVTVTLPQSIIKSRKYENNRQKGGGGGAIVEPFALTGSNHLYALPRTSASPSPFHGRKEL